MESMTREELKVHCKKEIEMCEFWAHGKSEELNGNKIYQEHKLILELLEQEPCEDAISRKAVNRLVWKYLKKDTDENIAFYEHFLELPSVTPQEQRWIPVSERLPEEHICDDGYHEPSEYVLVQMKSGLMHVARYWTRLDSRWLGIPNPTTDRVVAWMPLP